MHDLADRILTADEAARWLRLDEGDRSLEAARKALRRLIDKRLLTPLRYSKENRFLLSELVRFAQDQLQLARRD